MLVPVNSPLRASTHESTPSKTVWRALIRPSWPHWRALLERLGYQAPPYATARSVDEALAKTEEVGFPLLVRPSYVLGGRAMEIVYSREGLLDYLSREPPRIRTPLRRGLSAIPPPDPLRASSSTDFWRTRSRSTSTRCATGGRVDRRDHAARRGGRRALGRQRVRVAAAFARRGDARADQGRHTRDRAGDRGGRADQRSVCGVRRASYS